MISQLFDRRFLLVTGKGGVGKTTVSAALGLHAARLGKRVLVAQCNAKDRMGDMLEVGTIDENTRTVLPNLDVVNMTPEAALAEYGMMVLKVKALQKAIFGNHLVSGFLHGVPGMDAWSMLGKAYFHATKTRNDGSPEYDLVIVDAPATGHGLDMLRVPRVIIDVSPPGLLRREAERAWELFQDPKRAGIVLVSLAEEMPTNETIELHAAITSELKLPMGALIVNSVLPHIFETNERDEYAALLSRMAPDSALRPLGHAGRARAVGEGVQEEGIARLKKTIGITPVELPYLFDPKIKRPALEALAAHF